MDISFVVIGYNERATLGDCLKSVQNADLEGIAYELLYVDGGSEDGSIEVALKSGVHRILGGDKRRSAAENRNLGLKATQGRYVQFLDGDMVMEPAWPRKAADFLDKNASAGTVCGKVTERNSSLLYQAMQIDWELTGGAIRHCGGAALWRREVLEKINGFPENIAYGEEPFLCWRVRNELGLNIYYLNRPMVVHDLGFTSVKAYVTRSVRCGETYMEVSALCRNSHDPLWLKETRINFIWSGFLIAMTVVSVFSLGWISAAAALTLLSIIVRKSVQMFQKGKTMGISLLYALHVYLSKIIICVGQCRWLLKRKSRNHREAVQ